MLSSVRFFVIPWTVAYQVPLSLEFSRQEYWSGSPSPTPGDLLDLGIKPMSLAFPALASGLGNPVLNVFMGKSEQTFFQPSLIIFALKMEVRPCNSGYIASHKV